MKKSILLCLSMFSINMLSAQNLSEIKVTLSDLEGYPVTKASVIMDGETQSVHVSSDGEFQIRNLSAGEHKIVVHSPEYHPLTQTFSLGQNEKLVLSYTLKHKRDIDGIDVYGNRSTEGLDAIVRLPVSPREMPQTISVVPKIVIDEQGAQTITDVSRNVAGVTLFGTYGGVRESMSIRGYRGTPVLKNGILMDSDFRSGAILTDISGVDNVQVIKGSAAITQGIGNGLGSAGGVINVVTKTPQFVNKGEVSLSSGSWGLFRPAFDYQTVLDKKESVAFRLNGSYQRKDSYKSYVRNNRVYFNPSLEWRPDNKTKITLESDYFNDNTTPDKGTVNLSDINENNLYEMPHNKFLGWKTDNTHTQSTTYSAKIVRELGNKLSLRALYSSSTNNIEDIGASISQKKGEYNLINRSLSKAKSTDKNKVFQIDLIGKDLYTGAFKHTFQAGFDYKTGEKSAVSYVYAKSSNPAKPETSIPIDINYQIDVLGQISNILTLPNGVSLSDLKENGTTITESGVYGITAMDMVNFKNIAALTFGLRYSADSKRTNPNAANEAWDPFVGLMITPVKNISLFGNFATTTNLRSANNPMADGGTIGASVSNQVEVGIKTDWLNNKLGFNATYFYIKNGNIAYQVYENGIQTPFYEKAGDLNRSGIELEAVGNILNNLKVILGYAYLDVQYHKSPSYVDGSRSMNAPRNTANGWVRYAFDRGFLQNLSIGLGVYYVGDRPVNEWSTVTDGHGTTPGIKPFNMPAYTTVNAQLGYLYKNMELQVFFNNIFDEIGYTSYYRGGYINQIDPQNIGVKLSYHF
ncbi:MAG: TonB-dependent receptor [Flavobacteriaceae bacterium]|nr:TonB-dependent receptor [Flavobacteriaceae bacterium]